MRSKVSLFLSRVLIHVFYHWVWNEGHHRLELRRRLGTKAFAAIDGLYFVRIRFSEGWIRHAVTHHQHFSYNKRIDLNKAFCIHLLTTHGVL